MEVHVNSKPTDDRPEFLFVYQLVKRNFFFTYADISKPFHCLFSFVAVHTNTICVVLNLTKTIKPHQHWTHLSYCVRRCLRFLTADMSKIRYSWTSCSRCAANRCTKKNTEKATFGMEDAGKENDNINTIM